MWGAGSPVPYTTLSQMDTLKAIYIMILLDYMPDRKEWRSIGRKALYVLAFCAYFMFSVIVFG